MDYRDPVFPLQLRAFRALLDFSQGQLAELAGVSETLIYRLEKGERLGQVKKLEQLERALFQLGATFRFDGQSFGLDLGGSHAHRLIQEWKEVRRAQRMNLQDE